MGYWLVGETPNPSAVGKPHLWLTPDETCVPHTANRLLRFTGWSCSEFIRIFDHRTNLWPMPKRCWPCEGRAHAEAIKRQAAGEDAAGIVVLGARAAACFGLGEWPRFTWSGAWVRPIAVVPHPSGRCLAWDPAKAREFFASIRRVAVECA